MTESVNTQPSNIPTGAALDRIHQRNFTYFLADFIMFSVALQLLGPTTVIPDFVRKLTSSEILIGISSQLFEIGYLLPQLLIARQLVRVENKKWWFIGPNLFARLAMIAFAGVIILLGGDRKPEMLALFMLFYMLAALGDGLVGVPWMDLLGSSLDNNRRARLFGYGTASVGIVMLGGSQFVRFILGGTGLEFPNNYALLFGISGLIFIFTIPIGMMIHELPGGKPQTAVPTLRDYLPQLGHVLRTDRPFRIMLTARIFTTFATLASPFYIGFATEQLGIANDVAVSNLLLMQTLGSVSGALIYSWLGSKRSLEFIRMSMALAVLQPILALIASAAGAIFLYVAFLGGGVAIGMLGMSFTNWVIDYSTHEQRPVYSGLFNTMSALGFLIAPIIGGTLVQFLGYETVFVASLCLMLSALITAMRVDYSQRAA